MGRSRPPEAGPPLAEKPRIFGDVAEWLNAAVSKTVARASGSEVQILSSPFIFSKIKFLCYSNRLKSGKQP